MKIQVRVLDWEDEVFVQEKEVSEQILWLKFWRENALEYQVMNWLVTPAMNALFSYFDRKNEKWKGN